MDCATVENTITQLISDAAVEVEGADCDFTVTVIAERFEGLNTVKRQQMILAAFAEYLATGELHALSVKTYTLNEWNNKATGLVQLSL